MRLSFRRLSATFDLRIMVVDLFLVSITAWVVMLFVGIAHANEDAIPALSFWGTWFLLIAVRVATAFIVASNEMRA